MNPPKIKQNNVRRLLNEGKRVFGAWLLIPSPITVELAGYAGLDFAVIDNEHGRFNDETIEEMIRAGENVGIAIFVRVVENTPPLILKVLNAGADGILVSHVCTRADAEAAVRAAHYAPTGFRGQMHSLRRDGYGTMNYKEYVDAIDREIMVFLTIEDVEGIRNLDEIASVPGVDALVIGRADLAQSMGIPGEDAHPDIAKAEQEIRAAAKAHGLAFYGEEIIDAGIDLDMLLNGWKQGRRDFEMNS
jgi:2-keto-3-deoxy-L-rhamnonate aldolase RhmA